MEIITGQIAEYNEYRNQVAELVKTNAATIFDYESTKGEKEARSYCDRLRTSKAVIEKKRKELGEDLVSRKKLIDGEAKQLIETVDSMIDVHMKPLKEKAQREAERVAMIDAEIMTIDLYRLKADLLKDSTLIQEAINQLELLKTNSLQERQKEGEELKKSILQKLATNLEMAIAREATEAEAERLRLEQQAELEELRKKQAERAVQEAAEKAERERIANEERIKSDAIRETQVKAEEAAQAKIREAEEAQKAAEAETLRIKREAEENAAKIKREADAAEAKRIVDAKALADADAKRAADIEHRKAINNEAVACFVSEGFFDADAKNIVTLIAKGVIANITIKY